MTTDLHFNDQELLEGASGVRDALIAEFRDRYAWEDVACVICGPGAPSELAFTKFGISMRSCVTCGHLFVSPRLPESAVPELYGAAYWDAYETAIGSSTLADRVEFDYQNGFGKLRRDVLPYRQHGALLDVGASNGGMVRAARESGFSASGIEPAADTCQIAKQAHGIDLYCGDIRDDIFPEASFDVVTMHDVIEHVFDPEAVLDACRRVLSAGGIVVMETPTSDSLDFVDRGVNWPSASPLEHVNLFSEGNLAALVERTGFRVVDAYCPHENNVVIIGEIA